MRRPDDVVSIAREALRSSLCSRLSGAPACASSRSLLVGRRLLGAVARRRAERPPSAPHRRCCATRCGSPRPASTRRRSRICTRARWRRTCSTRSTSTNSSPVRCACRPNTAAALPEASADFKTFTIRVRPGIYFSDDPAFKGVQRELIAAGLRLLDQAPLRSALEEPDLHHRSTTTGSSASTKLRQAALRDKKPFDYDAPVEGLRALDRYTLQFKLAEPNPRFTDELSDPARTGAVAREVVEFYGDKIMEHPVGTGAVPARRVAAQLADRVREEPELPRRLLRRGGAGRRPARPGGGQAARRHASCR